RDTGGAQLVEDAGARRTDPVRAYGDRAALVVRGEQRRELVGREFRCPLRDEPLGMRRLDREAGDRIRGEVRERPGLDRGATQHRVHEPAGAPAREPNAGVNGGVRGDAGEERELIEAETEGGANRRVEAPGRRLQETAQTGVE